MVSIESKVLNKILHLAKFKNTIEKFIDSGKSDEKTLKPPKKLLKNLTIEKNLSMDRVVFTLKPKNTPTKTHILYLHGGAYINNLNKIHWNYFDLLIRATNCTITVPDYPLAPKFTYKNSFEMVESIYEKLLSTVGSENVILMGDSAGAGFALALAQLFNQKHNKNIDKSNIGAKQLILLSPWLDVTMSNRDIIEIDLKDPILSINGLKIAGKLYAGDLNTDNYLLSPINGDLRGLGKISIFIGTNDILLADARRFRNIARENGIDINYYEYLDMVHVWMLFNLPESKKAIGEISSLVLSARQVATD